MSALKLYDHPISGNSYKIRLFLSILGLEYERVNVDLKGGESLAAEFKKLNPRGQIPVLRDGDVTVWDSMAILNYLAAKYATSSWWPTEVLEQAQVMQWLAVSENELLYGLARARATIILNRPFNLEQCQSEGHAALAVMDAHLEKKKWLATSNATIADIACYPYIFLAPVGEVSLDAYPNVVRWMADVEAIPGWVSFDARN